MRDELIEVVVAALDGRWPVSRDEERQASAIALDAILERMREPDETMCLAGDRAIAFAHGGFDTPERHTGEARDCLVAALATIRSPKI